MSEIMRGLSFEHLINWSLTEYKTNESIFGIIKDKFYKNESNTSVEIFNEKISTPLGPAAGPNSQLAQNILTSYLTGARFFEVKTVQVMDGKELRDCVQRPCINVLDEGYNVEWSTELTVKEAFDEYVKGWFLIQIIARELGISETRDFAFNMSVGYDLEGIKSEKVNTYIDNMIDAKNSEEFKKYKQYLLDNLDLFKNVDKEFILNISSKISPSITLSTLHGCPKEEIEKIAMYLLKEKKIHTFIKCNPTLLGYEKARSILNEMGYDYVSFDTHHFDNDLKFDDAKDMLKRLLDEAKNQGKSFGVKITNTFPVQIKNNELPGEEMYMSGRSLYPLSLNVAKIISDAFNGQMQISFSGGADFFNIDKIYETGIFPITVATTILKPGGYERMHQLAKKVEKKLSGKFNQINCTKLTELANGCLKDEKHLKHNRQVMSIKQNSKLFPFDCFSAPCRESGCPISQKIPQYVALVNEKKYDEAFKVISIDNPLPSITGTICDHKCTTKCTRVNYETPVYIREHKLTAASLAQQKYIENLNPTEILTNKKVAVIGAGPAGVAAASFIRRNGVDVTVFEEKDSALGIVKHVIPNFRIANEVLDRDYQMAVKQGVKFKFNVDKNYSIKTLKEEFDYVIIATGAWKEGINPVSNGSANVIDALDFLSKSKISEMNIGEKVAIIGAGDVAMDCARMAKRTKGVKDAIIVYRRTREFMPAQLYEIEEALADGVEIKELLSPISFTDGKLVCEVQSLIEKRDSSGRKMMKGTNEQVTLSFDTVIGAVGARVSTEMFERNDILLNEYGYPKLNGNLETTIKNVFVAGDCKEGAKTVVKAIADAKIVAKYILSEIGLNNDFVDYSYNKSLKELRKLKGDLKESGDRCLSCDKICEICVSVCPNRANLSLIINAKEFRINRQILHIDSMCNECGNCGIFCPHQGNPYKDKITLFKTLEDFMDSTNKGFCILDKNTIKVRTLDNQVLDHTDKAVSFEIKLMIETVLKNYKYLLE